MLSLSHCETMLNSVKGEENIKKRLQAFFFLIPKQHCRVCVCVLGVEFRSAAFQRCHSSLQVGKQVPLKSTKYLLRQKCWQHPQLTWSSCALK